ncbi:spore coat assembly protein SafA [Gracilibacillus orientalis]|uniref:Spore coat assembly protein SafA n=1 Tax=Gracilibacillus orientalis TaxID=334253 RepID=A0A1I4KX44_9BACI|nr:spore coat assembly protein SafA [Gracilibacillus orientalis]
MKQLMMILFALFLLLVPIQSIFAATHIVQPGDSLWKISLQYKVGLSEIIEVNEQIENPDLIYPNPRGKNPY